MAVWSASRLISRATTEKPRPNSPAFSASMAALRDRRFVWSEILLMVVTTLEILLARSLMTASLEEIDVVALTSSRIAVSIWARSERPVSAMPIVSLRDALTPSIVWARSSAVADISRLVAVTSVVEAACWATVASSSRAEAAISVAEVVTWMPERCTWPMSESRLPVMVSKAPSSSLVSSPAAMIRAVSGRASSSRVCCRSPVAIFLAGRWSAPAAGSGGARGKAQAKATAE